MSGKFKGINNSINKINDEIKKHNFDKKNILFRDDDAGRQKLSQTIDKQNEVIEKGTEVDGKLAEATLPSAGLNEKRDKWCNTQNRLGETIKNLKDCRDSNLSLLAGNGDEHK